MRTPSLLDSRAPRSPQVRTHLRTLPKSHCGVSSYGRVGLSMPIPHVVALLRLRLLSAPAVKRCYGPTITVFATEGTPDPLIRKSM